jgi:hypothetical protein
MIADACNFRSAFRTRLYEESQSYDLNSSTLLHCSFPTLRWTESAVFDPSKTTIEGAISLYIAVIMSSTAGPSGGHDGTPRPASGAPPPLTATADQMKLFPGSPKHQLFCKEMGIKEGKGDTLDAVSGQFYYERKKDDDHHKYQYWLVASIINFILLLQIMLGATATALTASKIDAQVVSTVLTAVITVSAGILAFLKSKGQPNRARQLRNDFRKVVEEIDNCEMEFRDPNCKREVVHAIASIRSLYETARRNAETNYPDQWVALSNAPVHSNYYDVESGKVKAGFGPVRSDRSNVTPTGRTSEEAAITGNIE